MVRKITEVWVEVVCKLGYYIMEPEVGSKFYDVSHFQSGMCG